MMRKERRKRKQRKILNFIIVIVVIVITLYVLIELFNENNYEKENYEIKRLYIEDNSISIKENNILENLQYKALIEQSIYPKENIEKTYKGYDVLAKLEIPKIELETYIINFSETALKVSVTKFWGPEPNKTGNFCVAGHNFRKNNMFHNLKKLEIGDKFFNKDNDVGVVNYEIYNIYTVFPDDVSCLSQNTNGKKEVTLITCTNDSKKRIIIKAREC